MACEKPEPTPDERREVAGKAISEAAQSWAEEDAREDLASLQRSMGVATIKAIREVGVLWLHRLPKEAGEVVATCDRLLRELPNGG